MEETKIVKCIVAEDYEEMNRAYTNMLNYEKGIEVVKSVFSGAELISALDDIQPDVILMDIEMESPSAGIRSCKAVMEKHPEVKVIMLTGHDEEDKIMNAFGAGAINYILKTSSITEIVTAIKNAYFGNAFIHPAAAQVIRKNLQNINEYKRCLMDFTKICSSLTQSELSVLKLILQGYKQKEIAEKKNLEQVTIKTHVRHLLKKFNVNRTSQIVKDYKILDMNDIIKIY